MSSLTETEKLLKEEVGGEGGEEGGGRGARCRRHCRSCCFTKHGGPTKGVISAVYFADYIMLGLVLASISPTLLELARRSSSQLDQVTTVLTARSVGKVIGSAGIGYVMDKWPSASHYILAVSTWVSGACTVGLALSTELRLMIAIGGIAGLALGCMDAASQILTLWLHGEAVAPYMQALHTCFGAGALLSPLMVHAATINSTNGAFDTAFYGIGVIGVVVGAVCLLFRAPSKPSLHPNGSTPPEPIRMDNNNSNGNNNNDNNNDVEGSIHNNSTTRHRHIENANDREDITVIGYTMNSIRVNSMRQKQHQQHNNNNNNSNDNNNNNTTTTTTTTSTAARLNCGEIVLVLLLSLVFGVYVGLEVGFGSFIFTYSVYRYNFSNSQAELITSLFWGTVFAGRFCAIWASNWVRPVYLMWFNLLGCLLAGVLLVIAPLNIVPLLWVASAMFGFCMSSIFPSVMVLAEGYLPLTGKVTAAFMIGSATGELAGPLIMANLIEWVGASSFAKIALGGAVVQLTCVALAMNRGSKTPLAIARARAKRTAPS